MHRNLPGTALSGAGFRVFGDMVSGPMVDAPAVTKQDDLAALTKSVTGFTLTMNVDYPSESLATIVKTTLAVDPDLQPDKVQREMSVQGPRLCVTFTSVEARFLRASFSAFMELPLELLSSLGHRLLMDNTATCSGFWKMKDTISLWT